MTVAASTEVELAELELEPAGPSVVAIGGGHGLAEALKAVCRYASDITAVVSVADDGGSSGRLTAGLGIPPPGDIRRCLLALTPDPSIWSELFSYRFAPEASDVGGHSLGNLIIAALSEIHGDFAQAVRHAGTLLGAMGAVVPAADRAITLGAIVGGRRVDGQAAITRARGGVERLILGPDGVGAHPSAAAAIGRADQIVLGPGSLFTSIMPALMVPGIAQALERSPARIVFVLNLVTQDGETLGLAGADHLRALAAHAGIRRTGEVVVHRGPLHVPPGLDPLTVGPEEASALGWTVHEAELADPGADRPMHDPAKLGRVLEALI